MTLQSQAAKECHCDPVEKQGKRSHGFGDCFPAERGISLLARISWGLSCESVTRDLSLRAKRSNLYSHA